MKKEVLVDEELGTSEELEEVEETESEELEEVEETELEPADSPLVYNGEEIISSVEDVEVEGLPFKEFATATATYKIPVEEYKANVI